MAGNSNSGRRPDAVRARFQRILEESGAHLRFHKILKQTEKDETFIKAYELANDRAFGKAAQYVELNDISESRVDRARLEESIRRIADIAQRAGVVITE